MEIIMWRSQVFLVLGLWETLSLPILPIHRPSNHLFRRTAWSIPADKPSYDQCGPTTASQDPVTQIIVPSRRCFLGTGTSAAVTLLGALGISRPTAVWADDVGVPVSLVPYKDPIGLFSLQLPKTWYKIRPVDKGDLPDETGKGRRGSRIFSSGDISNQFAPKILAIERFPAAALLAESRDTPLSDDIASSPFSWSSIGSPERAAKLLIQLRDKEGVVSGKQQSETRLTKGSVTVDGPSLTFLATTEIPVMRPDLLQKEAGMLSITRIQLCHAEVRDDQSVAGPIADKTLGGRPIITALWVSAEQRDWTEDKDAKIAKAISDSFVVY